MLAIRCFLDIFHNSDEDKIKCLFSKDIIEKLLLKFSSSTDFTVLNELLLIFINLTFVSDEYISFFICERNMCQKLFSIISKFESSEIFINFAPNIFCLLGNCISDTLSFTETLKIFPFHIILGLIFKQIDSFPNNVNSMIIWFFAKGLKRLPSQFIELINYNILKFISMKAEFIVEGELCYEAIGFFKTISDKNFLNNSNEKSNAGDETNNLRYKINDLLIKAEIFKLLSSLIKKNYDFSITIDCFKILHNLLAVDENISYIKDLLLDEFFLYCLNNILWEIKNNCGGLYKIHDTHCFIKKLLDILKNFIGSNNYLNKKLLNYQIEFSIFELVLSLEDEDLIFSFLTFIKMKLQIENKLAIISIISLGVFEFISENILKEFIENVNKNPKLVIIALEIIKKFFTQTESYKFLINKTPFELNDRLEQLRSSNNDNIAELSNTLVEDYLIKS